ncbi:hypothetical protein BBJ28_00013370 [Nothophytophthora sp. Chile5]|nr:hypothetical protein BBJ28_00013370 [Nothophytophthora sp. Chile5]
MASMSTISPMAMMPPVSNQMMTGVPSDEQLEMVLDDLPMLDADDSFPLDDLDGSAFLPPPIDTHNSEGNAGTAPQGSSAAEGDEEEEDPEEQHSAENSDRSPSDDDDGSANSASSMPSMSPESSPIMSRSPGVPGVIFALGSCGSATLRLHGPPGLRGFLGAIRSFVRRKYPQIQCVEVTKGEESAHNEPEHGNAGSEERASFGYETWPEGDEQRDQHARIIPVTLRTKASDFPCGDDQQNICLLCSKAAPTGQSRNPTEEANKDSETPSRSIDALRSGQTGRRQTQENDEHEVWRAWLSRYYAVKAPEKAPYSEVVLNRYRGRYDDLKVQLCAKYGDMDDEDASAAASASSSSSSDSEDSDNSDDGIVNYEQQPLDRKWLQTFYAEHQPDKLPHVDKVLKQFSSREETLKQMLLSKYGQGSSAKRTSETKTDASAAENTASNKKRKLLASAEEESKTMVQEDEPAKIFVDDASVATTTQSPILQDAAGSLCYIVQ